MANEVLTNALPYDTQTITLAAGQVYEIRALHSYLAIEEITAGEDRSLSISYTGSRFCKFPKGFYLTGFTAARVWFRNDSANSVTVTIGIGSGELRDSRFNLNSSSTVPIVGTVSGMAAHDAAVSGNPLLLGAEARSSERAAVAQGDAVRLAADLAGKLVTSPYALSDDLVDGMSAACAGVAGTADIIAAAAAGKRHTLTSLSINNTNATATEWELIDGDGTVRWSGQVAANGHAHVNWPSGLNGTVAGKWSIKQTQAGAIKASAAGYTGR